MAIYLASINGSLSVRNLLHAWILWHSPIGRQPVDFGRELAPFALIPAPIAGRDPGRAGAELDAPRIGAAARDVRPLSIRRLTQ